MGKQPLDHGAEDLLDLLLGGGSLRRLLRGGGRRGRYGVGGGGMDVDHPLPRVLVPLQQQRRVQQIAPGLVQGSRGLLQTHLHALRQPQYLLLTFHGHPSCRCLQYSPQTDKKEFRFS